jgi:hypothetical protein
VLLAKGGAGCAQNVTASAPLGTRQKHHTTGTLIDDRVVPGKQSLYVSVAPRQDLDFVCAIAHGA